MLLRLFLIGLFCFSVQTHAYFSPTLENNVTEEDDDEWDDDESEGDAHNEDFQSISSIMLVSDKKKFNPCPDAKYYPECHISCEPIGEFDRKWVYADPRTPCTLSSGQAGWCSKEGSCVDFKPCDSNADCGQNEFCDSGDGRPMSCQLIGHVFQTSNGYLYSDRPMGWDSAKSWCEANGRKMARMPRDCCVRPRLYSHGAITNTRLPDSALAENCTRCGAVPPALTDEQKPLQEALDSIATQWDAKKNNSKEYRLMYSFWLDYYVTLKGPASMAQLYGRVKQDEQNEKLRRFALVCPHPVDGTIRHNHYGACGESGMLEGKPEVIGERDGVFEYEKVGMIKLSTGRIFPLCQP